MKRRLVILATFSVFLASLGIGLFPNHASAATSDYYYTDDSTHNGIQGPNPYATGGQSSTVTYHKTSNTKDGIYVAENSVDVASRGTCYPAVQTSDKKYDGSANGKIYLDCGYPDSNNLVSSKGSISIGKASDSTFQNPQLQQACQGKSGQALEACQTGYKGGTAGKTEDQTCGSYTGDNLNICDDAWTQAQGGDTSPTCESSGPLAWVLCPIFNMLSDASSWIFGNIVEPFLITPPISTDPTDPSFQIWSSIRVYGDIFLVIALLVIVFGESIGGGLIDAYTAKKVLPRLLVAAVLINLSIYIVALLVDITNVLGKGVGDLLTAPLAQCHNGSGPNCWDFNLSGGDQARVFGVGLVGLLAGGTAAVGFLGTILFAGAAGVSAIITVAFFTLLPMFFAILAVFITLIIRKGLILMLVLISPVAFALYCLPNTERFFKRWWDLLIEALMVYPIIVAIFAVADILSITILSANNIGPTDLQNMVNGNGAGFVAGNLNRTLSLVVAFLLQFLPLLAIPFAFRFASGALGRIYEAATGAGAKVNQMAETRREHAKRDYRASSDASRARVYHASRDWGERHRGPLGIGRAAGRFVGRRAGGYNIEAVMSAGRAETAKELNDQIATGRDEEIRGLTVNKQWSLQHGQEGVDYRTRQDGTREFKSLGGAWIAEQDVDAGHGRWGNNQHAQQTALSYEMRKAITEEDAGRVATNYANVATGPGGWGMSDGEAAGAFKGAAFENQNQHVEYKYTGLNGTMDAGSQRDFVDEIYNNKGSYPLSQMNSHTIQSLKDAHTQAVASGDIDQQQKIAAISETFMHSSGISGMDDEGKPIPSAGGGSSRRQVNSQGSAHTAERVFELARQTGVLEQAPGGAYTNPDHSPTPGQRSQSSIPHPPNQRGPGTTPRPPTPPASNSTGRSIP